METEQKWYDVHLDEYRKIAYVNSKEQYEEMYRQSLEDPDTFGLSRRRNTSPGSRSGTSCCAKTYMKAILNGSAVGC